MRNMYIGIDNGVTGGIACLSMISGELIAYEKMPIKKARGGNEIDCRALRDIFEVMTNGQSEKAIYVIEEPGGSKSAQAAKSMSGSFHATRAIMEVKGLVYHRITPQKWQKAMLPNCKAGDTKPRALALTKEIYPEESFILKGCRKAHDGIIDAVLIAEYARREKL